MIKWAVAYISFFDNELKIKIVETDNQSSWKDALSKAFNSIDCDALDDYIDTAKEEAFDGDWLFDVVKITYEKGETRL